jgi:hypothetical protein
MPTPRPLAKPTPAPHLPTRFGAALGAATLAVALGSSGACMVPPGDGLDPGGGLPTDPPGPQTPVDPPTGPDAAPPAPAAKPDAAPDRPAPARDGSARADAAARDAGAAADAGPPKPDPATDGSAGPAPGGCPHLLCESFEEVADGALPAGWQRAAGQGTIGVGGARANRGKRALHVVAPSGSYETYMRRAFSTKEGTFYGRLFFFMTARRTPTNAGVVHWNLVEARGSNNNNRARLGGIDNKFAQYFNFNLETQSAAGETGVDDDARPSIEAGKWHCVEWMFQGGAADQQARLWWNGEERPRIATRSPGVLKAPHTIPDVNALFVGWAMYQNIDAPYDVWIDDLALDTKRIGCE